MKGMSLDFGPKQIKMKNGDIVSRVKGTLWAVCWRTRGKFMCFLTCIFHL
jgi:hypothetical protein